MVSVRWTLPTVSQHGTLREGLLVVSSTSVRLCSNSRAMASSHLRICGPGCELLCEVTGCYCVSQRGFQRRGELVPPSVGGVLSKVNVLDVLLSLPSLSLSLPCLRHRQSALTVPIFAVTLFSLSPCHDAADISQIPFPFMFAPCVFEGCNRKCFHQVAKEPWDTLLGTWTQCSLGDEIMTLITNPRGAHRDLGPCI